MEYLDSLPGNQMTIPAIHHHKTQKMFKPRICNKEGTIGKTAFMDKLIIKLGWKVILIHIIDTVDCPTNGQLGILAAVIRTTAGEINKQIIELKGENVGKKSHASRNGTKVSKWYSL